MFDVGVGPPCIFAARPRAASGFFDAGVAARFFGAAADDAAAPPAAADDAAAPPPNLALFAAGSKTLSSESLDDSDPETDGDGLFETIL